MSDLEASSRPRILLLAILVVLIGSFGALVLAPLLDAPPPKPASSLAARLGFELEEGPASPEAVRISVRASGGEAARLAAAPAEVSGAAGLARRLAGEAADQGWVGATADGAVLALPSARGLALDPGPAVVTVAVEPDGLPGGYRLTLRQGEAPGPPGRLRVALVASPAPEAKARTWRAEVELPLEAGAGAALDRLAAALMDAGFGVERPEEGGDHVWIRALPDGRPPHALLLTVAWAEAPAPGSILWLGLDLGE